MFSPPNISSASGAQVYVKGRRSTQSSAHLVLCPAWPSANQAAPWRLFHSQTLDPFLISVSPFFLVVLLSNPGPPSTQFPSLSDAFHHSHLHFNYSHQDTPQTQSARPKP